MLGVDVNKHLNSIADPAGGTVHLTTSVDGLLATFTDPNGNVHTMTYDDQGRLIKDADPAGGFKTLTRTDTSSGYSVAVSTALGRTTSHLVEKIPGGGERRVLTDPSGAHTELIIGADGTRKLTSPDGTVETSSEGPDPRWGMQAPVVTSLVRTTPGGLRETVSGSRSATLANPIDPMSLQTLTDTATINGRTFTSKYDGSTRTITSTSAAGRTGTTTLDVQGHVVQEQIGGLNPVTFTYDPKGRLASRTEGSGADARTTTLSYSPAGFLETLTDPLNRVSRFSYDAAGRIVQQTLPDGQTIGSTYDANSNTVGLTPPGRPAHTFGYTSVDLLSSYSPPDLGAGATQTSYTYDPDRQLTGVTRPDGVSIGVSYDAAGRPGALTLPRGQIGYTYSAAGQLTAVGAPGGLGLTYAYDGTLPTSETWTGGVAGSLARSYDTDFHVTSLGVNGANVTAQYDADSLLTQAGALALNHGTQNDLVTGSTLGNLTDTWSYNGFGEPTTYSASASGLVLFTQQYTRDALGRIV